MADHKNATETLKFDAFVQSPTEGMFGGIVIMWKEGLIRLDSISVTTQGIHVEIKQLPNRSGEKIYFPRFDLLNELEELRIQVYWYLFSEHEFPSSLKKLEL